MLGELLQKEQKALLAMRHSEVAEIVTRKETLLLRIKALDESRRVLARRLGESLRLTPDEITLTELSNHAPQMLATRLRESGDRLREIIELCKKLNDFNSRAARQGARLMSDVIEQLLTSNDPSGQVYSKPQRGAVGGYRVPTQPPASRPGFIQQKA